MSSSRSKSPARSASKGASETKDLAGGMKFFQECISKGFSEGSLFDKISLAFTLLWNMPMFLIGFPLLTKLGLRKHRDEMPNGKLTLVCPNVYQIAYWGGQANSTVIVGQDGSLLVHLAPPPQPSTLAALDKLGDVKVILFTSAHDTYAAAWQKLYPEATVLAPGPVPWYPGTIDGTVKGSAAMLATYHVVDVLETTGCTRGDDCALVLEIAGKKAVILPCGIGNQSLHVLSPLSWWLYIAGFGGFRVFRQYALVFTHDCHKFEKFFHDIAHLDDLQVVVLQHGEPLRKNIGSLADVKVTRSLAHYPWPWALD